MKDKFREREGRNKNTEGGEKLKINKQIHKNNGRKDIYGKRRNEEPGDED